MHVRVWFGISSGLIAGTLVGFCEGIYVLAGASTGEYVALIYGSVLYGLAGMVAGAVVGMALALLGLLVSLRPPLAWTVGFVTVFSGLGLILARYLIRQGVYDNLPLPMGTEALLLVGAAMVVAVGIWLGLILLQRTPLKILLTVRGTVTLEGLFLLLAAIFSFTPVDFDSLTDLTPERHQPPDLHEHPNIILIVVDTLRADHLGAYGETMGLTPALDRLAAQGVVYEQAFASATWTRAAMASLMTSTPPSVHRTATPMASLPEEQVTIAELLSDRDYITGGLPNDLNVTRSFNFQQGFDYFQYLAPRYLAGATESASRLSFYRFLHLQLQRSQPAHVRPRVEDHYQPAEQVLQQAQRFVRANASQRFFLWIHLMEPHEPYFPHPLGGESISRAASPWPPRGEAPRIRQLYAGEVGWLDQQVGGFLRWLEESGLADETVVILTADHGEELGDHGGWWHGSTLYEEQLHIPLIIRLPDARGAGARISQQVSQLDIAPTIAWLSGGQADPSWQGRSLMGIDQLGPRRDRPLIAEEHAEGSELRAIREGGWKYIRARPGNTRGLATEELYHVAVDPHERHNLIGREGATQARLAARLRQLTAPP